MCFLLRSDEKGQKLANGMAEELRHRLHRTVFIESIWGSNKQIKKGPTQRMKGERDD